MRRKPQNFSKNWVDLILDYEFLNNKFSYSEKEFKRLLRATYTEEEIEAIVFDYEYTFSTGLMKTKISENKSTMKKNKAKGYDPKVEYNDVYGIVCLVNGKNFYWDCSCVSHDHVKTDEVRQRSMSLNIIKYILN